MINNKIFLALIFIIILVIILFLIILYAPFLREHFAFNVSYVNNQTHIINDNFEVGFDINKKCKLHSEFMNYISFRRGPWLGTFICEAPRDIDVYIWDYNDDLLNRRKGYNEYKGGLDIFVNYKSADNRYNTLTIPNKSKTKILEISILDEDDGMFDSIVDSLRIKE